MERKGFLRLVAEDIQRLFHGNYADVTVIFPNKRASLFMNNQLTALGGDRPMWTPQYITISEIFELLSDTTVADTMYLVCRLHQVYQEIMGTSESLDRFYAWGELLISDFDDIDNNLADAKMLFANISDLENLNSLDYLTAEQKQAIRQFFNNFDADRKTALKENFQSVWQHLHPIYQAFRTALLKEKKAYRGMQKRLVIEQLSQSPSLLAERLSSRHYAVVGFNVLGETEKQLFKFLKAERDTLFYWDYDNAYIDYEAGIFIRQNQLLFPNRFKDEDYYSNFANDTEKQITLIASPTEDAQCRYLFQWLNQPEISIDNRTAIVLCNEKALGAVLHAIPAEVKGQPVKLNVTMGFPLTDTPIYTFLCTLLDLQTHGRTQNGHWRYSHVAAVLKHPYAGRLSQGKAQELLTLLNKKAILFPEDSLFSDHPFLSQVFQPCETPQALTRYLASLIEQIGQSRPTESDPLFAESIYTAHTLLSRIGTIQETTPAFNINKDTYSRLFRGLLRGKSIPFHGEPAIGLQVMGLLETRNLDFDNLILLSADEGQMPHISTNNTFIPYTLRAIHGMTTIEKQTSLYAYYFYRLLQRAKNITLMFGTSTEGLNQGEMSRFLLQLQIEQKRLFAPGVEIQLKNLVADNEILPVGTADIHSSPAVCEKLRHRFDLAFDAEYTALHHGAKMTMSPSAINDYLDCRRRFFLKYVVGMKAEDELTDDVDDAMFGTLLHYCMEKIYAPCVGRQVQSQYLLSMARDREKLSAIVDEAFAVNVFKAPRPPKGACQPGVQPAKSSPSGVGSLFNGHHLLNKHVLITYIRMQLQFDAQACPFRLLGVEKPAYSTLTIPAGQGNISVRFGGIIDRYEQTTEGRIRIVDYKTSSREQTATDLAALFDPTRGNRSHHLLQAFYYCDVLTDQSAERPVYPQLMYVKLPIGKRPGAARLGKEEITDFQAQLKAEYHAHIEAVIREIFSPQTTFSMTPVPANCTFCDFKNICNR